MIKIGYLVSGHSKDEDLSSSLSYLDDAQPKRVEPIDDDELKYCPSVRTYYANTFEVKCPYDLQFSVDQSNKGTKYTIDSTNLDFGHFSPDQMLKFGEGGKSVQIYPMPLWSFVSDTPNVFLILHSDGITTNPQIISAWLDIYKWPDRPLNVAYRTHLKNQTIKLKKNEPLYRISFLTPDLESVKLVRMYERKGFLKETKNKVYLSGLLRGNNWKRIFNNFGKSRPKKLIVEEEE